MSRALRRSGGLRCPAAAGAAAGRVRPAGRGGLVERNILAYRRGWLFLVSGFFEPLFYLLSIGLGLNHLVGALRIGGHSVTYTDLRRAWPARVLGDERRDLRLHLQHLLQAQDREDLRRQSSPPRSGRATSRSVSSPGR